MQKVRARMLEVGVSQRAFAALLGISQTTLNVRLNGCRPAPPGFEERALAMLDRLEAANRAAALRRAEVLEQTAAPSG